MTKVKYLILLFITAILIVAVPSFSNAATEYTDTEQGIVWSYDVDEGGNIIKLKCNTTSKTGTVTIPSTIDGKNVISLEYTFENCAGLTGVTIPNTITTIGNRSFYKCTGLRTITIPDSVTSIGTAVFSGCSGITSVTLSQTLTSIGANAFSNCTGLKSVTIPDTVTAIGESAFIDCSGLRELNLSENLTKISDSMFEGCSGLTSVIIPESVTTIEGYYTNIYGAFGECKNLSKVLIPDNVVSIGPGAFRGCDKLTIYGNDGMTSKEYAEEKEINFKYISEWDNDDAGDDITPPTVESIEVPYSSVSGYYDSNSTTYIVPSGKVIIINVKFNETIVATTTPILTIKFGNGSNIELKNGSVSGSTITYTYTIARGDIGNMSVVSLFGGDVNDENGNEAKLSNCPALEVGWGHYLYANGTAVDVEGDKNPNGGDGGNNPTGGQTNGGTPTGGTNPTQKPTTEDPKDTTTAPTILPAAGINMAIISIIIGAIIVSVITIKKYNSYRDIK